MADYFLIDYELVKIGVENGGIITKTGRGSGVSYYVNSLLGFSHGDKEKKRISGIMQIEARQAWGRTLYHEFHLGHLHSEQTIEENGVIIRHLPSITGTDAWHHESGFVGAVRKCTCSLWDKECGLDSTFNIVIH